MANLCMDTVVFYAASKEQEKGLAAFGQAVTSCYYACTSPMEHGMRQIFEQNDISTDNICLSSDLLDMLWEEDRVTLYCTSKWSPIYEGYTRLAYHFGISFVLQAEEPGFDIYINTDTDREYLTTQYKVFLVEKPEDGSLDALFEEAGEETDVYFESEEDVLEWFSDYTAIDASTVEELRGHLDAECVRIHEFVNPY